jgi:hypothetical protein
MFIEIAMTTMRSLWLVVGKEDDGLHGDKENERGGKAVFLLCTRK